METGPLKTVQSRARLNPLPRPMQVPRLPLRVEYADRPRLPFLFTPFLALFADVRSVWQGQLYSEAL